MHVNPQNLLSINEVLADVLVAMNDEDQVILTPGFYRAQVKYAMDELGFDVLFLPQVVDEPIPFNLKVGIPKGCYNLTDIQVFTGTPDEVGYVENVYWKKGRMTRGAGTGYTSSVHHHNVTDPFFRVSIREYSKFYFTLQDGMIILSDSCVGFAYVRMKFQGIASHHLDEVKMVPPAVRKAVVLWVIEKCASFLKSRDSKYQAVQRDAAMQLDEYGFNGAWHEAKSRLSKEDKKLFKDMILYNSSLLTS